ncbi:MAG TPA: type II secretion system F family protein [Acidimicrobiales bacterium]|jgi:tight adherence protein C
MSEILNSPGGGLLLAIVASLGLSVLAAGVGLMVAERLTLRTKLREIDDLYQLVGVRDQELMLSLSDRVGDPAQRLLARLGRRLSPKDYAERIRILMMRAGRTETGAADRFLAIRALTLLGAPVVFLLAYSATAKLGSVRLLAAGFGAAACVLLPMTRLTRAVADREKLIRTQLPDILDLLVICMEAGLGFSAAVSRTVANVEGEMSAEFGVALGEMRAGASRSESLANLATRVQIPELQSFVMAIRQADEFGISVSTVLRNQAEEMRVQRRQHAQEKAQKAPVKMLVPMVFCIFPPLFLIVIGPAGIQLSSGGF